MKKTKKTGVKKQKPILIGTIRIGKNLKIYEKTKTSWKITKNKNFQFPNAIHVIDLFKAHKNFNVLIDKKNPKFLKGQYYKGKIRGARINVLPDGRFLDKAYSLFAKNLTIHDETSNEHWDVIYQNPNGKYAYVYTSDKRKKAIKKKYTSVRDFEKVFPVLEKNILKALKNKDDFLALPMYTLLKTHMRVGNEMYYNLHKTKGLTTLKKKDISIKGNKITFNYLAKGGVPMTITKQFPKIYIQKLKNILKELKNTDFVFLNENKHLLKEVHFKHAFKKYCGKEFYPHIIRSYYATKQAQEFLKHHKKNLNKKQINEFFLQIAENLGHKKFDKKNHEWKDSFTVTLSHYIQPDLVEKIKSLVK